jgi:spermidine synthase
LTGPDWFEETLHSGAGTRTLYRSDRIIHESHTGQQHLVLFENARFGRVLMLDGAVQLTEADEFIYHEMMAHVPLFAHPRPDHVLIVGGGDGGLAREVLKHARVQRVTQVEIDRDVIDFSLEFLPHVSAGAFDDARLDLVIDDGAAFVKRQRAAYDAIMVDSTDPVGPGAVLFTPGFYGDCRNALKPGGVLVTQNGVPFMQSAELAGTMAAFGHLFIDRTCYIASTPTYVGGPMAYGWGSDDRALRPGNPATLQARFAAAGVDTRYYTPEVHHGAFALPPYIGEVVAGA